jgi:outer membrane protein assembly factor BamB
MTPLFRRSLLALLLSLLGSRPASAGDWPQYGGPDRNGIAKETGLLQQWPEDGPPLLWKVTNLGAGYSPVSVAGSRLYTLGYRGDDEYVIALDRGTGKELWATSLGVARESHAMAFLRQRQPLIDGERLYALSTHGHLICLDTDQGRELWRVRYQQDFEGRTSPFGWTDYPLIDGEVLVCTPGGKEVFHVALDRHTGVVRWKSALAAGFSPSHAPMVIAEAGGVRHYVQNLGGGVVGIAARDGKLLWQYPKKVSSFIANMATPSVRGDRVFVTSGYRTGSALLRLVAADGGLEVKEEYFNADFQNLYGGIVVLGDHVYGGNGQAFGAAAPACFDLKAGKVVWQQKGPGQGSLATVAADGRLYLRFADGLMVLAEASPDGLKERGQFRPPHRSTNPAWSVPVIAHGRLFVRDQSALLCYDLRQKPPAKVVPPAPKDKGAGQPDAVFVPSPPEVVEKMLELAKVTKADVVYDLGSGDGRIVLAAAKRFGARAVGIELDAALVQQARDEARKQGVEERVTFRQGDLFAADLQEATVITLYLLPHLNAKLLPRLAKLKAGTRIVSHAFAIPGVEPDRVVRFASPDELQEHTLYLYVTPLRPAVPGTGPKPGF